MFLTKFTKPTICFVGDGGGGGGGGGGRSKGRNRDADMYAGSNYAPTKNAGTSRASQSTYSGESNRSARKSTPVTSKTKSFNSKSSVTANDLSAGRVSTYKAKSGSGSLTVSRGTSLAQAPTVNVGVNGNPTRSNTDVYNSQDVAAPKATAPVSGGGSSAPVTAPERLDETSGVGGGRDGGASSKRKAGKTQEDKVTVERKAKGVGDYKQRGQMTASAKKSSRKANPMAIAQRAKRRT